MGSDAATVHAVFSRGIAVTDDLRLPASDDALAY